MKKTYDISFSESNSSDSKGFTETIEFCKEYIQLNNGTDNSYFKDYKGGIVSIVCNETSNTMYEVEIN